MKIFLLKLLMLTASTVACQNTFAQSSEQLRQDNRRLKAELQALQIQCQASSSTGPKWQGEVLQGRLDSIRIGQPRVGTTEVTATLTIRNMGASPMILNYLSTSMSIVDEHGYRYERILGRPERDSVKGMPVFGSNGSRSVDTSATLPPGGIRTITFIQGRRMNKGQTPGRTFDINATFVQFEDLGQGRIRKVRDFPLAFTNVTPPGR